MGTVSVRFTNYWRNYTYLTNEKMEKNKTYEIVVEGSDRRAHVIVDDLDVARPAGITLKTIVEATEVIDA